MSAFGGFDEAALAKESGLSDTPISLTDNAEQGVVLHTEDRDALNKLGEQPAQGIQVQPPKTLPAVPDYLSTHIPAAVERQAAAQKDYAALWESTFNEKPAAETVDQTGFESEILRRNSYDGFLAQQEGLDQLRDVASGKVEDKQLVQDTIRAELHSKGLRSQATYDNEMAAYIVDGELTELGQQLATQQKTQATTRIRQIEEAATTYANTSVSSLTNFYQTLDATAQSFQPYGIKLEETMLADMREDIRSGQVDAWLETNANSQEAAEKAFWLALISDPQRRAELIRLVDARGQEYGANKRLAAQL